MSDSRNTMAYLVAVANRARNTNPTNNENDPNPTTHEAEQTPAAAGRPPGSACAHCGESFVLTRSDSQFCSNACRQAAYRKRREAAGA